MDKNKIEDKKNKKKHEKLYDKPKLIKYRRIMRIFGVGSVGSP